MNQKQRLPCKGYLRIFNRVCIEGRTPEEVARELEIKVESVSDVVWKVRSFMRKHGAGRMMDSPVIQPVMLAREVYLARLEFLWHQAMEAWKRSQLPQENSKAVQVEKKEGQQERRSEVQRLGRCGDVRFLAQAKSHLIELIKQCGPATPEEQGAEYVHRLTLNERLEKVNQLLAIHSHPAGAPGDGAVAAEEKHQARAA